MDALQKIFDGLMERYKADVPDVSKITKAMVDQYIIQNQFDIENDHVAFRTIGIPKLGIKAFEKIFLNYGYKARDRYNFESKKLNARWYASPTNKFPRVFISELRIHEFPKNIQELILKYTNEITNDPIKELDLNNPEQVDDFLHTPLWSVPSWEDYQSLLKVSEYAAWVIYNRYYLNHYTIAVSSLPKGFNTLESFNDFLNSLGILLSDAGGYIKESPDKLLLQSATVSQLKKAIFAAGDSHLIAGSYVEFAERKILPEYQHIPLAEIERKHRKEGFEAANADKIFESTFTSQLKRK
ncbi:DUF1338 domain-containing protein [Aquimarina agarivorans]|uniref:DUF1338 domain-containing protein n=1 Tax=Aquimarina agarivorans TaxID=980584 RepID=UPI0003149CFB|nr:DUF1338 domain-containing protein [Aquimarina agarivorans]